MKIDKINELSSSYINHQKNHQTMVHSHIDGQLYLLTSGVITFYSQNERWTMTPNCIGWIPPKVEHGAMSWGNISGWSLYLSNNLSKTLSNKIVMLQSNPLANALIERVATFCLNSDLTDLEQRLVDVLIDEVKQLKVASSLILPLPKDPRLIKITQAVLNQLDNDNTQQEWASYAGMSVRSFSRYFLAETGMTFARWRQLARVISSLEKLAKGEQVSQIAYSLGYSNVSAYIASFKSIYGVTPNQYFATP